MPKIKPVKVIPAEVLQQAIADDELAPVIARRNRISSGVKSLVTPIFVQDNGTVRVQVTTLFEGFATASQFLLDISIEAFNAIPIEDLIQ